MDIDDVVTVVLDFGLCPVGDLCVDAVTLALTGGGPESVSVAATFDDATFDGDAALCDLLVPSGPGLWYRVTGQGRTMRAELCNGAEAIDTVLTVYCPEPDCASLLCVGRADEGCGGFDDRSLFEWCAEAGRDYLVHVGAADPDEDGDFLLEIFSDAPCAVPDPCFEPLPLVPANDDCVNAEPLMFVGGSATVFGHTVGASGDPESFQCSGAHGTPSDPGVWYRLAGTGDEYDLSLCNSSLPFNGRLQVFCQTGDCSDLRCVPIGASGCSISPRGLMSFCTDPGITYLIRIADDQPGAFRLDVSCVFPCEGTCGTPDLCLVNEAPANDDCVNAEPLLFDLGGQASVIGQLLAATGDPEPFTCLPAHADPDGPGVWYSLVGAGDEVTVGFCESSVPGTPLFQVFCRPASCAALECVPVATSNCAGIRRDLTWCTEPGTRYLVRVWLPPPGIVAGAFEMLAERGATCAPADTCVAPGAPRNDDCANAEPLVFVDGVATASGQTVTATDDPEAVECGVIGPGPEKAGVWFSVVGTGEEMTAMVTGPGPSVPDYLQLYCLETDCSDLACADGASDVLTWCSAPGETYLLRVSDFFPSHVDGFELTVTIGAPCVSPEGCFVATPPVNDDCADAIVIGEGLTPYDSTTATTDGFAHLDFCGDTAGDGGQTHEDIWFLHTASTTGPLLVTTCEELGGSATHDTDLVFYDAAMWPALCGDPPALESALIACNEDDPVNACGTGEGGFHSTVYAPVTAGGQYLIRVGSWNVGNAGTGQLLVTPSVDGVACDVAVPIAPGTATTIDTCAGAPVPDDLLTGCDGDPAMDGPGIWFEAVGDGTTYTLSVCADPPGAVEARVRVFCFGCDDLLCALPGADLTNPTCPTGRSASWCTFAGAPYRILVQATGDPACGAIVVELVSDGVSCASAPCFPTDCTSVVDQPPYQPEGPWWQSSLFSHAHFDLFAYERVDWPGGNATHVRWSGGGERCFDGGGFCDCPTTGHEFEILFFPDNGGLPNLSTPLCVYGPLSPNSEPAVIYLTPFGSEFEFNRFDAVLTPSCPLPAGPIWVSVRDTTASICAFLWLGSPIGDGTSLVVDTDPVNGGTTTIDLDLSLCIEGSEP